MFTNRITAAALALAATAGVASAQPFVHNIGELTDSFELANDLTLLDSGNIAFAGQANNDAFNFQSSGYIVINSPMGVPLIAWVVEDFDSPDDPAIAIRQDPADGQLIVLQQGFTGPGAPEDYTLYKLDQATGVIQYAWRYSSTTQFENLGMELDEQTGVVAATVRNTANGEQPSLLRFDNATGLPLFFNRYQVVDAPVFNAGFYDVLIDQDTSDIYAVGYADVDDPVNNINGRTLLIARFTGSGAPIFFRVYDAFFSDTQFRQMEGISIERIGDNQLAITARRESQLIQPHVFHMNIDNLGNPLNAVTISSQDQMPIFPATSSLELAGQQTLLVAGTTLTPQGLPLPSMWNLDANSLALNWWYMPQQDALAGQGLSAIPQPQAGALLGGQVFPFQFDPFGGIDDALLLRTSINGQGLCPTDPLLIIRDPFVNVLDIPVFADELPSPVQAGLEVVQTEPQFREPCAAALPCPTDLDGNGFTDLNDLLQVLANFGGGAGGDVNGDGFTDLADLLAVLANFGQPCP